ncbi:hypothetical protein PVAP13_5NG012618 [Panicum virgatum]|uniref:Uncharacterized protein n=1 Tax=Panicum virgatum TaxID=38727 RepID=A0A8T0S9I7_PANVG|nr:hypothetical protein PVAP13_5NG012618 [Panicum virgatum]
MKNLEILVELNTPYRWIAAAATGRPLPACAERGPGIAPTSFGMSTPCGRRAGCLASEEPAKVPDGACVHTSGAEP